MQLVDGYLHRGFGEHLRAHVQYHTRSDNISRHVCDCLVTEVKVQVWVSSLLVSSSDALTSVSPRLSAVLCQIRLSFADFYERLSDAIFCNRPVFVRLGADITWRAHVISQISREGEGRRHRTRCFSVLVARDDIERGFFFSILINTPPSLTFT